MPQEPKGEAPLSQEEIKAQEARLEALRTKLGKKTDMEIAMELAMELERLIGDPAGNSPEEKRAMRQKLIAGARGLNLQNEFAQSFLEKIIKEVEDGDK